MWVRRLELRDFRSYARGEITFSPDVTVLLGSNGQGKTNLVEALYRVATGSSHRTSTDRPLVRMNAQDAIVRCELVDDHGRDRRVELQISPSRRSRTRVDSQDVRRASDAVGVLRAVLFAPEDLAIIRGEPTERRRFLDELLGQRRPAYAAIRGEYERVLRQRNQLLRDARGLRGDARDRALSTLSSWTHQLLQNGAQLMAARTAAVARLEPLLATFYDRLTPTPGTVTLRYESTAFSGTDTASEPADVGMLFAALEEAADQVAADEIARGTTLVGPHRDDVAIMLNEMPARSYASQGEAWSLAIGLKLATYDLLTEVGDRPVVLLDDVFSELDEHRRECLAAECARFEQVIVTAAVDADVPLDGPRVAVLLEESMSVLTGVGVTEHGS